MTYRAIALDEGVSRIRPAIERLKTLKLRHTRITDASLVTFKNLPVLEALDLSGNHISDFGVTSLSGLPRCFLTSRHSRIIGSAIS